MFCFTILSVFGKEIRIELVIKRANEKEQPSNHDVDFGLVLFVRNSHPILHLDNIRYV